MAPGLMPRQLDADGGRLLKEKIETLGVRVHLLTATRRIEPISDRRGLRLHFQGGDSLEVDLVVVSAGIRPRDDLAASVGLEVHSRGGVHVDDRCRTSDPKIYAIGECAEHRGVVYGLVGPCYQMADVVARNLLGRPETFRGADLSATLKLMGVEVTTLGCSLGETAGGVVWSYETESVS